MWIFFFLRLCIAEIGLDNSIPTGIDDGYYDSEGDIQYLKQLLNDDTSSDGSHALLPKKPSPLVSPPPASKPGSYDVTFSNPLFDFNDDYTLCYDNPLFDEEFKDISSLDPLSRLQLLMNLLC
ncbi:hypothetical protein Tco_0986159 [Tanacetum coccineum]